MENLTITKVKTLAETSRMTTLADTLQILLTIKNTKNEDVGQQDEECFQQEHHKTYKRYKRNIKCKYWNKCDQM